MLDTRECLAVKCPIQFTLDLIASKWSILILRELFTRNCRTYQLLEALPGISTKTLTQRLRELETYGLVKRTIYPEIPPRVEYSLTDKGWELQPVMQSLYEVGKKWLEQENCNCPLI